MHWRQWFVNSFKGRVKTTQLFNLYFHLQIKPRNSTLFRYVSMKRLLLLSVCYYRAAKRSQYTLVPKLNLHGRRKWNNMEYHIDEIHRTDEAERQAKVEPVLQVDVQGTTACAVFLRDEMRPAHEITTTRLHIRSTGGSVNRRSVIE